MRCARPCRVRFTHAPPSALTLSLIVLVRTSLSFSLEVELDRLAALLAVAGAMGLTHPLLPKDRQLVELDVQAWVSVGPPVVENPGDRDADTGTEAPAAASRGVGAVARGYYLGSAAAG